MWLPFIQTELGSCIVHLIISTRTDWKGVWCRQQSDEVMTGEVAGRLFGIIGLGGRRGSISYSMQKRLWEPCVTKSEVTLYGYSIQLYNTTHISYPLLVPLIPGPISISQNKLFLSFTVKNYISSLRSDGLLMKRDCCFLRSSANGGWRTGTRCNNTCRDPHEDVRAWPHRGLKSGIWTKVPKNKASGAECGSLQELLHRVPFAELLKKQQSLFINRRSDLREEIYILIVKLLT